MDDNPYLSPDFVSEPQPSKRWGVAFLKVLTFAAIVAVVIAFFLPATRRSRESARRTQCRNNLKQISLALHIYADEYHAFPPAHTVDANGQPLHSWRTLLLPFLDQQSLYAAIDLSKPWNDPVNADVRKTVVPVFLCPSTDVPSDRTTYLALVTTDSCFQADTSRPLSEIKASTETIMVFEVEAEKAVHWMDPSDTDEQMLLAIGPKTKSAHNNGTHFASTDGSVRFMGQTAPPAERLALISVHGHKK